MKIRYDKTSLRAARLEKKLSREKKVPKRPPGRNMTPWVITYEKISS